jgi:peptide deformylase
MEKIITDLSILAEPSEPLKFLTEKGIEKEEGEKIIAKIKSAMEEDKTILTLTAPQIGIKHKIFCIRFNDTIKTFINPIVTKKDKFVVRPETCVSLPGKEILITRPEEITVVYYTDEFKYEENKLLGAAARLFDQSCHLLDGVTPDELGLVSDVATDGSLADCSEEEIKELVDFYKNKYIPAKAKALNEAVKADPELEKKYKELQFTEKVITGNASIVGKSISAKGQAAAALSIKKADQVNRQINRAQLMKVANKSRKYKGGK